MQLLDDDMDELFRNAASQYPLKTDGADWDALSSRLQSASPQGPAAARLRDSKWFWLGMLILLTGLFFIICTSPLETGKLPGNNNGFTATSDNNKNSNNNNNSNSTNKTIANTVATPASSDRPTPRASGIKAPSMLPQAIANNTIANNTATPASSDRPTPRASGIKAPSMLPQAITNTAATPASSDRPTPRASGIKAPSLLPQATTKNTATPASSDRPTPRASGIKAPSLLPQAIANNTATPASSDRTIPRASGTTIPSLLPPATTSTVAAIDTNSTPRASGIKAPSTLPQATTKDTTIKHKSPAKVQRGLYLGIIASPDFSTVKMQRIQKPGYSAGIILGYRISRSLAVETGLLYDHKNYYSEGSCFNRSKIPYTQNWKILNVDGYCNMWEIPVNIRYFIKNGQQTSWYANAGLSSYLMKKEDYAFKYLDNYGTLKNNSWDYKNATRNWFSIIHVGVGLEHNLGVIGKLRVEPYLKIPASGLGIGDLPITSMGVNVGITKSIR